MRSLMVYKRTTQARLESVEDLTFFPSPSGLCFILHQNKFAVVHSQTCTILHLIMASIEVLPELYPEIQPYDTGFLKVSDLHTIYYEQSGNASGNPVIYL